MRPSRHFAGLERLPRPSSLTIVKMTGAHDISKTSIPVLLDATPMARSEDYALSHKLWPARKGSRSKQIASDFHDFQQMD
jgi:hypothetical protein